MVKKDFISVDPEVSSLQEVHNLLLGGVTPRPIALVSTLSERGVNNLAPFSFFNAFGANPPYVAFSPAYSGRDGAAKDTLINIRANMECVIHSVSHEIVEQMSLASSAFPPEVDEFVKAGFTALPSHKVGPQRVAESAFHMECVVEQIIELGGSKGSGNLVLCRVVQFHIQQGLILEGIIPPDLIDNIGRNSGAFYTRASGAAIFELNKPAGVGMGVDMLPDHIRQSHVLSGNDLGLLGGTDTLPTQAELKTFLVTPVSTSPKSYEQHFNSAKALALENRNLAIKQVELAAKEALEARDLQFALRALLSIPLI